MDVTLLLNTAGAPVSKPLRSSASPAITDGGHTVPSSALPTPSPERALGPAECENSPRQNTSLWGPRGYSLRLALQPKPRSEPFYSCHVSDGRTETESESFLFDNPRSSSVCSTAASTLSAQSPHTTTNRALISPRSSRGSLPSKILTGSFISPEQSDAEHGAPELRHLALRSHGSQSTHASPTSKTHSRTSSITAFSAPQPKKEKDTQYCRGRSFDTIANGQRSFHQASRPGTGSMSADDQDDMPSSQSDDKSTNKIHKRTMSAPDIAQCSVARMPRNTSQPIISELHSSRPNIDRLTVEEPRQSSTAAEPSPSPTQKEPECLFIKDCDTGSQLRKAISHLFGRNKACTLRIPKHIWVSYCRKHYQRIRYRNAKTYPLTQMELVKLQIRRLQAWSDENKERRSGPYIRMWALSLRKREQSRLKNGGASVVDEGTTAVPPWLIQRVAAGYSTENILSIAERLHGEIKEGLLAQVPEIEFLPDIVDPDSVKASNAARNSRRLSRPTSGTKTPKRKAPESLDFGRRDSVYLEGASVEGIRRHGDETYEAVSPSGKRARIVRQSYDAKPDSTRLAPMVSALAYGTMQPPPPPSAAPIPTRAPAVVPMIQPLEYRRGSTAQYSSSPPPPVVYYAGSQQHYQQQQGPHSWDGGDSPHSARSDGHYALCSSGHQPLPPISTQFDGRFSRGVAENPDHLDHRGRPHHWRSASAYMSGDPRGQPFASRPPSPGHEVHPHHVHMTGYPPNSRRGYDVGQQKPPYSHQYAGRGPEHGHGVYSLPRGHLRP